MLVTRILGAIGAFAVSVISALGYFGVFFLMILESMVVPVPSELVMPFAGYLASTGRFSFWLVVVASTLGSIVGSLISYYIGKWGGHELVVRYGKWVLLNERDLHKTRAWFQRRGDITIFIARLIPVVRHLISIPAGAGHMDLKKFSLYTIAGAGLWNAFLAYMGYYLGQHWGLVRQYSEPFSVAIAVLLGIGFVYFVYKHVRRR